MLAKSTRKNQARPPAPPTILIVTLNADGSGNLVAKRGDLAAIRQFTYREMKDIIAAIQQGAAQLVAVEKDPPPADLSSAPSATSVPTVRTALPSESETYNSHEVEEAADPNDTTADSEITPENSPLPSVRLARTNSSSAQMSLL